MDNNRERLPALFTVFNLFVLLWLSQNYYSFKIILWCVYCSAFNKYTASCWIIFILHDSCFHSIAQHEFGRVFIAVLDWAFIPPNIPWNAYHNNHAFWWMDDMPVDFSWSYLLFVDAPLARRSYSPQRHQNNAPQLSQCVVGQDVLCLKINVKWDDEAPVARRDVDRRYVRAVFFCVSGKMISRWKRWSSAMCGRRRFHCFARRRCSVARWHILLMKKLHLEYIF